MSNGSSKCNLHLYKRDNIPIKSHLQLTLIFSMDYFGDMRPSHILIVVSPSSSDIISPNIDSMSSPPQIEEIKIKHRQNDDTTSEEDISEDEIIHLNLIFT